MGLIDVGGANRIQRLTDELLDKGYEQTARQTLTAIASSVTDGAVARRLAEFEAEAARLSANNEPLRRDNPYLVALVSDYEAVMARNGARVDAAADDVQRTGVDAGGRLTRLLAAPNLSDEDLLALGVTWQYPDPEAINAAVGFVNSAAWRNEITKYAANATGVVERTVLAGIVNGQNPIKTARQIRAAVEGYPARAANNLMRTLQLESYRQATALNQRANADILAGQIRVAALDVRTCLACIALHGQRLPVGVKIQDHHQGRCTAIPIITGIERNVQTGPEWFDGLSYEQKNEIFAVRALGERRRSDLIGETMDGIFFPPQTSLFEYVQFYDDPVFGRMIRQGPPTRNAAQYIEAQGGPVNVEPTGLDIITPEGWARDDSPEWGAIDNNLALSEYILNRDDSPRVGMLLDLDVVSFAADGSVVLDKENFYKEVKNYMGEMQFNERGRTYWWRDNTQTPLAELQITVNQQEAERIFNENEARRADMFLTVARLNNVRLTAAQRRRLEIVQMGGYLEQKYEVTGDEGSLVNAVRRNAPKVRYGSAEYNRLRDDWDRTMEQGKYSRYNR